MLRRLPLTSLIFSIVLFALSAPRVDAAPPSTKLLPDTVKAYLSIPDIDVLRKNWQQTQFAQLIKDDVMKEFVEDFRRQTREKLGRTGVRLGFTLDDLNGVAGGEISLAAVQPEGDKEQHAIIMLVDTTAHRENAEKLLANVAKDVVGRGGKQETEKIAGEEVTVLTLKGRDGDGEHKAYLHIVSDQLVATDHRGAAAGVIRRVKGEAPEGDKTLATATAFKTTVEKCDAAAGDNAAQLRWFIDPFGYVEVLQASSKGANKKGGEILHLLSSQGFSAIKGVGGLVVVADGEHEVLHHTYVYAPPPYENAGRMLDFPLQTELFRTPAMGFSEDLDARKLPQKLREAFDEKKVALTEEVTVTKATDEEGLWILANSDSRSYEIKLAKDELIVSTSRSLVAQAWLPRAAATYVSFKWDMKDAFNSAESLVDAAIAKGAWKDLWNNMKDDPNGPRIDIQEEFVAHLADRVTFLTDYKQPITTKSERWLLGFEVTNPKIVAETVDKAMETDPQAKKRTHKGHIIWEIVVEGKKPKNVDEKELDIFGDEADAPAPAPKKDAEEGADGAAAPQPNMAVTVLFGNLLITSNVDVVVEILKSVENREQLARSADYRVMDMTLEKLGAKNEVFRVFARTDESYRPTYELIRQGKMPQAETILGKVLNGIFGPDEEGVAREQQIDGSKLPPFDTIHRFFGPAGLYATPDKSGWLVTGCVLDKNQRR